MCSICNSVFCPSSCPGYDRPNEDTLDISPLAICDCCGATLYFGDKAMLLDDYVICAECIKESTVSLTSENAPFKI